MAVQRYDVLVVGAGSSGCALAARLSERADRQVVLVEAGPHYPRIQDFPPEMAQVRSLGAAMPGHPNNWSFVGDLRPGRSYPMARGKVVGGSSAVNGVYFVRARRDDFAEWSAQGNSEWDFDKVLPYFIRSETDHDFADEHHGTNGPIPVRRPAPHELRPVSRAFIEACLALGFKEEKDKNDPESVSGVGPVPQNSLDGVRMNTAVTYLAQCMDRPNFTLLDECAVERVIIRDGVAVGVQARHHGSELTLEADEIVLCAGGIKTPQLLQLSGIGPANVLRPLGIPVVRDAPVGRYVRDHPSMPVSFRVDGAEEPAASRRLSAIQVCLTHTSPESPRSDDLQISCLSASFGQSMRSGRDGGLRGRLPSWAGRPLRTARALVGLSPKVVMSRLTSQSQLQLLCQLHLEESTGSISITSASASDLPRIDLDYLSHPADLPRLQYNVRRALEILASEPFRALGARVITPGPEHTDSDEHLDRWITDNISTAFHTCGGARMGPDESDSVVDQYGRVHGVRGLRVADISILPTIIRRSPHATAVMIGERVAGFFDPADDRT